MSLRIRQPQLNVAANAYTLTAAQGAFTFTGQDAGLPVARNLPSDQGAFTLSGQAVTLTSTGTVVVPVSTTTASGGGAGPRRGHAFGTESWQERDARRRKTEAALEAAYERLHGATEPDATKSERKDAKAIMRAISPHVIKALLPEQKVLPRDAVNWDAVAADLAAMDTLNRIYERIQDEEEALTALLLA